MRNNQELKENDVVRSIKLPAHLDAAVRKVAADAKVSVDKVIEMAVNVAVRKPNTSNPQ